MQKKLEMYEWEETRRQNQKNNHRKKNISKSPETYVKLMLLWFFFFDENKIKIAKKSVNKKKENPVGCTGDGKR